MKNMEQISFQHRINYTNICNFGYFIMSLAKNDYDVRLTTR
jgi:hypothetical protein